MAMRFKNLDGSGPHPFNTVFKWAVVDKLGGKRRKSPARAPVPHVAPDLAVLANPPAPGEGARLTWLGHASWLVQLDGISLLIDPVLRDAINVVIRRNVPPGVPVERLPPITASLVSHNHYDHLDLPTLKQVGARVVTGLGHAPIFQGEGLPFSELDWWESTQVGPVRVHYVPAQHWSRRGLNDANQMLWGGFVVEGSSARIYHSGDTAYFQGFKEIGSRFPHLDAALLPIGAYDPAWFMRFQHMNPEEAVQAFEDLGALAFLAMHWGTFKLTDEPLDEPPLRLDAEWLRRGWPRDRVHVLPVGGTHTVRHG
ncbi:MBL fold metallo-hydrolase [Corallococcus llansteffanensis]|uniref:MBL fold metallo-hydrolase n=1 Tax=Corallococcus llansteffanensis TaxID=2316731 RepID=A0A3A8NY95_9BACT|nr:MBL fold metallo-hydrolase [Corallococcus llansteffanensis]RKH49033.1 MBL fold metallo-hydrolase [Corallococcus llansteffanensis]